MRPWLLCCVFLLAAGTASAQAPPNDTCAGAIDLLCTDVAPSDTITTNTAFATNDYDQAAACTAFNSQGPDIAYRIVLPPYGEIRANLDQQTYDSSLYLIRDCSNPAGTCVAGDDNFPFPGVETVSYTNNGSMSETLFLIVDGFNSQMGGPDPTQQGVALLTYEAVCPHSDPAGACCREDGTCFMVFTGQCFPPDTYQGDGTSCDPNPCMQPTGACCFPPPSPGGGCVISTAAECQGFGGVYQGDGTTCDPDPCPPPPMGACCATDGNCILADQGGCQSNGGFYVGDGTDCEPNECVVTVQPTTWGRIKNTYRDPD